MSEHSKDERPVIPAEAVPERRTPTFTAETVPLALLSQHQTAVWASLIVTAGSVTFSENDPPWTAVSTPGNPVTIVPGRLHQVDPSPDAEFAIQFFKLPIEPEGELGA